MEEGCVGGKEGPFPFKQRRFWALKVVNPFCCPFWCHWNSQSIPTQSLLGAICYPICLKSQALMGVSIPRGSHLSSTTEQANDLGGLQLFIPSQGGVPSPLKPNTIKALIFFCLCWKLSSPRPCSSCMGKLQHLLLLPRSFLTNYIINSLLLLLPIVMGKII